MANECVHPGKERGVSPVFFFFFLLEALCCGFFFFFFNELFIYLTASTLICSMACGISVPRPGIEPTSPALQGGFFIYIYNFLCLFVAALGLCGCMDYF